VKKTKLVNWRIDEAHTLEVLPRIVCQCGFAKPGIHQSHKRQRVVMKRSAWATPSLFLVFGGLLLVAATQATADPSALAEFYKTRMDEWRQAHRLWAALHFFLGISSIVLSVAVASFDFKVDRNKKIVCFAAAICAAVLTFLSPTNYSRAFKEAWIGLEIAYTGYLKDEPNAFDLMKQAHIDGQKSIDKAGPW
jgi:succinate dehydrogenase/fumarate reductase cytochrome b subunit